MQWADIQTNLIAAVRSALDDSDADVVWVDRTNAWRNPANVKLQVVSFTSLGRDERRYTEESGQLRERLYGPRRFVVSFRCETQDQDLVESALPMAERISTMFHGTAVTDLLDAAGLGVARVGPVRQMNTPDGHDRVRSVAVVEINFNAASCIQGALIGYVSTVEVSGDISNGPDTGPTEISDS